MNKNMLGALGCMGLLAPLWTAPKQPVGYIRHDRNAAHYEALGSHEELKPLGWLGDKYGEALLGSCVLLDSMHVLTAAHNLFEYQYNDTLLASGKTVKKVVDEKLLPLRKLRIWFDGSDYEIKKSMPHPHYVLGTGPDLMLLRLKNPVKNIRPASWRQAPEKPIGRLAVWAGYSPALDATFRRHFEGNIRRRAGENVIDSSLAYLAWLNWGKPSALLLADMDHPELKSLSKTGSGEAKHLEYLPSGGDSGGGVFLPDSSGWHLIGIIHANKVNQPGLLFNGMYGTEMTCTEIAPFKSWIDKILSKRE